MGSGIEILGTQYLIIIICHLKILGTQNLIIIIATFGPDQIDTPRVLTDNENSTLWVWNSKPFGESQPNEDVDGDGISLSYNLRFPGQYYDAETNIHYNFNRDYNPVSGRYIQSDPIGLDGGMNGYGYVGSNPIFKIDSSGLLPNDFYAAEEISTLEFNGYNIPFIDVCYGCTPLGPFDEGMYDGYNDSIIINAVHLGNYSSMWNNVLSDKDAKQLLSLYFHELIHANQGPLADFLLGYFDSRTGRNWIGNALHQRIEEHAQNLANYHHEYFNSLRQQPLGFEYFTNGGAYPCAGEYPCQ